MNRQIQVALGLATLLTLNLVGIVGLLWMHEVKLLSHIAAQAIMGILFGQNLLLGCWLALGDVKWYWRGAVAIPATLLLGQSVGWPTALVNGNRAADDSGSGFVTILFLLMLLLSYVALWPLRRLCSWRLTWRHQTPLPVTPRSATQFHTADLLFWMIPIGGALVGLRFLISLMGDGSRGVAEFLLTLLALLVLLGFTLATAFANGKWLLRIAALLGLVLLISIPFAGHEVYAGISAWHQSAPGGRPWQDYLIAASRVAFWSFGNAAEKMLLLLSSTVIALLNFLALRALGCQLSRPGTMSTVSSISRYNSATPRLVDASKLGDLSNEQATAVSP